MFEFSVIKQVKKISISDNLRFPAYILAYLPTLIVKELKISLEDGRVVTSLNLIKL